LGCASFVFSTARDSGIKSERNVIGVGGASMGEIFGGMSENDIRDWRREYGLEATIENLLSRIKMDDVYVSIDLDVMSSAEVVTNFDQGDLCLEELLELLHEIMAEKNIISASVLGYSGTRDAKSLITYAAVVDVITESDRLDIREWASLHGRAKRGIIGYDDVVDMVKSK
jgi:arginase family enzyme